MTVTEIAADTWRLESLFGTRFVYQYVVLDGDEALIVDTGDATTPRDVIMPGLWSLGIAPEQVRLVLVTHPDLDHQGGLAGLREQLPNAIAACGFADRMMVSEPERLVTDRYGAYQAEHGLGYGAAGELWMRANYGAPAPVEVGLAGGETLAVGDRRLVVRHAPGHSAGHLIAHEPATGLLLTSDAVHGSMCPAADGAPALPPTYEDVDPYLETIDMIEMLDAREMHSGHWPARSGPEIGAFLRESREFVERMDDALLERLQTPATLEQLCVHADQRLGPFGAEPVNLMFAVYGHVQRLLRAGRAGIVRAGERPPEVPAPMKITAIDTVVVHAEMRNWVFVKVSTDEGLVGWGESTVEWKTRAVVGCIEDYRTLLVGEDPRRVEHIWQMMYRQHFFRPGMVECSAMSGIEHACWDIAGKALGAPVHQLLGGAVRDTVRLYDHLGGGEMVSVYHTLSAEEAREKIRESLELGFDAIKLEVVIPRTGRVDGIEALRHADSVMAAVREEAGDGVELMVDMHGRCSPMMALQYFTVLEPYRPWFFEEPCPPEHPQSMAELARRTTVPIATGERLCTRHPFRELLKLGACSVLQPDAVHCGGISELRRIAAMGEAYHAALAPHSSTGPIGHAASMHVAFATPNFLIQETWRADVPWRFDVLSQTLPFEGSTAQLPTAPGLGIEVDEKEAAKHPFQQEPLMRYFHPDGSVADW